jgi:hypothetical protein
VFRPSNLPTKGGLPLQSSGATLVDLIDRVLDRGIVINIDLIISLAGVPLIGINLRAAIAGIETMINHGIMKDWDEATRMSAVGGQRSEVRGWKLEKLA